MSKILDLVIDGRILLLTNEPAFLDKLDDQLSCIVSIKARDDLVEVKVTLIVDDAS